MRSNQTDPETFLPLTPAVFNILLALADGERHGYSIMQEIINQTQGKLRIGPTTLYRSIKHMLEGELIVESDERPDPALDDERRRYYRLTNLGQRVAVAEMNRLEQMLAVARSKSLLGNPGQIMEVKGV
ncbi:PadR family transcriptional regulator [Dictyobacter vulcani]|uniref:PadR family transcriptional regulator n=1 Tax=Dictyobacter vulcani TaxID=2607529 RepID=A0A5J4KYA2_9CHLR|nr:PadR family transcriptional regulator [Dictyobacter vulcani]GER91510.1 PadR family transcriptional regulator [Dictyobacter vulcani]